MESDEETDVSEPTIIHTGLTFFPTYRQGLTLLLILAIECEGIYICLPLNQNSNVSFLIGQIFLFVVIFYSWYMVLQACPGPMSELFNEEFVKKTIEQGLQPQTETENKVCARCQIQSMAKLYNCEQCNRCVYKRYFHSKWLNTCVAKENFPQFTSFLVFLEFYLILMEIDNVIFFVQLRSASQEDFADFFVASFENAIACTFLFVLSALILMVMSMLGGSFFMALRVKGSVQPFSCKEGCEGLKKKSTHDKLMMRLRQSIRQSNVFGFNNKSFLDEEDSHHNIFRETQDFTAKQLNVKSLKKSIMLQSRSLQKEKEKDQQCSIQDYQGPYFKTDFFESAKIFRKKQDSMERKKRISRLSELMNDEEISKMTASTWKKYIKSTFEKEYDMKRSSKLKEVVEKRTEENGETPMELMRESSLQEETITGQKSAEQSVKPNIGKRKLISKYSRNDQFPDSKQFSQQGLPNLKKLRFVKKSQLKLTDINEKDEKLEIE